MSFKKIIVSFTKTVTLAMMLLVASATIDLTENSFLSEINTVFSINTAEAAIAFEGTAYSSEEAGQSFTASGLDISTGAYDYYIVACNDFPLHTKLYIEFEGRPDLNGVYSVEDRCGYDGVIDVLLPTVSDCYDFGRRIVYVTVVG